MEVVDDDEEGPAFCEPDRRRGDGDEDARLLLLLGCRSSCQPVCLVVTEQALDDGRVPAKGRVLAGEQLQPREEGRREWQVREVEVFAAAARGHLHAAVRSSALNLAQEAGLPDAGLARDQDQLRLAGPGVVQALLEPLALVVSIDERANTRRLLPDHRDPHLTRTSREG